MMAQPGSRVNRSGHLRFRVFVGTSEGEKESYIIKSMAMGLRLVVPISNGALGKK